MRIEIISHSYRFLIIIERLFFGFKGFGATAMGTQHNYNLNVMVDKAIFHSDKEADEFVSHYMQELKNFEKY